MTQEERTMEQITGYLFDVDAGTEGVVTIEKSLSGYYKALKCSQIEIITRTVDGRSFAIVCDEEALLKDNPIPSGAAKHYQPTQLYGNILVVQNDGAGDVKSLTDDEIKYLYYRVGRLTRDTPKGTKTSYLLVHLDI